MVTLIQSEKIISIGVFSRSFMILHPRLSSLFLILFALFAAPNTKPKLFQSSASLQNSNHLEIVNTGSVFYLYTYTLVIVYISFMSNADITTISNRQTVSQFLISKRTNSPSITPHRRCRLTFTTSDHPAIP
jgi:hypothetical protein